MLIKPATYESGVAHLFLPTVLALFVKGSVFKTTLALHFLVSEVIDLGPFLFINFFKDLFLYFRERNHEQRGGARRASRLLSPGTAQHGAPF